MRRRGVDGLLDFAAAAPFADPLAGGIPLELLLETGNVDGPAVGWARGNGAGGGDGAGD